MNTNTNTPAAASLENTIALAVSIARRRVFGAISLSAGRKIAATIAAKTVILSGSDLPACHAARENIADDLAELGWKVRVNRFGTGNAFHSGVLADCGVESIEITF